METVWATCLSLIIVYFAAKMNTSNSSLRLPAISNQESLARNHHFNLNPRWSTSAVERPSLPLYNSSPNYSHNPEKVKEFSCTEPGCGKSFYRKFTLKEHAKTHTGIKPYVCKFEGCTSKFSTSGNLSRHKHTHSGIKPYACQTPGCSKKFCTREKLMRHTRTHSGLRPFKCKDPTCNKDFTTSGNLSRHMKIHRNESGISFQRASMSSNSTDCSPPRMSESSQRNCYTAIDKVSQETSKAQRNFSLNNFYQPVLYPSSNNGNRNTYSFMDVKRYNHPVQPNGPSMQNLYTSHNPQMNGLRNNQNLPVSNAPNPCANRKVTNEQNDTIANAFAPQTKLSRSISDGSPALVVPFPFPLNAPALTSPELCAALSCFLTDAGFVNQNARQKH